MKREKGRRVRKKEDGTGLSISLIPEMVKFEDQTAVSSAQKLDGMTAWGPCQLHCYLTFLLGRPLIMGVLQLQCFPPK